MKIVVGLGNPGEQYNLTRHNTGMMLVDKLAEQLTAKFPDTYGFRRRKEIVVAEYPEWLLVKSSGIFMNESGRMVREVMANSNYFMTDVYVAHDDLDIKLGEYKIQFEKGPKVHGGINSIEEINGTKKFWRIRIGVDNRVVPVAGEEYVLQRFSLEEKKILDEVIEKAVEEILK